MFIFSFLMDILEVRSIAMKQKKLWLIIGIIGMVLVVTGMSYALWTFVFLEEKENMVTSDCLNIKLEEDTNSNIKLENMYPMNELEGIRLKPYTFSIENVCTSNANYQIIVEVLENSTMPDEIMKVKLNEKQSEYIQKEVEPKVGKRAYELEKGRLKSGEKREYEVRMWMDEERSEGVTGNQTFIGKIRIETSYEYRYQESILNGTDPVLKEGLIPVTIEKDGVVKKADESEEWYQYANQKWANAVILEDESIEYQNGETIPESNIESYFVWIPKYRYKLWDLGNYTGLSSIDSSKVHDIEIIFGEYDTVDKEGECKTPGVSGSSGNCKIGDYMTHPAFQSFGTKGIWVGKFEVGYKGATSAAGAQQNVYNSDKVEIKPNVYSWRSINVSNAHLNSYNYKREYDSHMMKNTEWGAVAYLQHSIYGSRASVRINNNSNYITGYSATAEPTCGYTGDNRDCNRYEGTSLNTDGTYTKRYNSKIGYLASTTNNISGIYDMSGGSWEYMMGVMLYSDNQTPCAGRDATYTSGFAGPYCNTSGSATGISLPEKKYYDTYLYGTDDKHYSRRILGDATGEMGPFFQLNNRKQGSWYSDENIFVWTESSWFNRSGNFLHGMGTGIFTTGRFAGSASGESFRIVLAI